MSEGQRENCGGKRINIFHSEIKFITSLNNGILRMEFEKLKFGFLRMKKFGILEMKFK
jgi:hypothetical protein